MEDRGSRIDDRESTMAGLSCKTLIYSQGSRDHESSSLQSPILYPRSHSPSSRPSDFVMRETVFSPRPGTEASPPPSASDLSSSRLLIPRSR